MDKKDPIINNAPSIEALHLALSINSIRNIVGFTSCGNLDLEENTFENAINPVLECVFEWQKNHPVAFLYHATRDDFSKKKDFDGLEDINDISVAVEGSYGNGKNIVYFQVRRGVPREYRCWEIITRGGFCGCDDPNSLYKSPDVWNFVTDDPAGMLAFISERTGNPIIKAKGSAPWSFENLVLVDDDPNDFYAAITASTERAFDKLPAPIYPDGDPVSIP
ncbi:MAG: hypothetical protein UR96_C0006G0013 [candidate division WS6 bacterium GW2011_GWC1_36_11]|uniref:Uncharacterized protein n=3 Tax=Candidatus Dojkabacteria TaxID=74243 RepID=A0A0G0GM91_9BACT|nr:MAG: hypothetical protein UR96_C0006G0013 [candidate division WS6 bacterium GW2011_GWC1_36_11]KKQ04617.1 MAG: hypothetical protein US14_C0004G0009 [candidate division WS6 bacterium GW2011_WS6_36_26]KKQ11957.1 MAG: hypothetical protein US24_C0009G0008 [candidate division WS6 bacterium GW2011_GWC2_36_7]KKQ17862.1 MAG: hypothetical protein US29_C0004G0008 [candidate division WS6 bacterium GW2011_GWF1_36_8]HAM37412.1 hypothetical protein [Patescibacteria group bacterium]